VSNHVYSVWVADSLFEQATGLGDIAHLEPDQGMIFIFPQETEQVFWMKDVAYPIDIIWINDGKVIGSVTAQPDITLRFKSPDLVNMVLEVPAGTVARDGIKIGDKVALDES